MRRKFGALCMILGTVLVGMALSLFLYNRWEGDQAEEASSEVLQDMLQVIQDSGKGQSVGSIYTYTPETVKEMTTETINGYEYIGYLSIPSLGLELPVMSEWSYAGLKIAVGRYAGSVYTDDLVICGHNYPRHFSQIKWLDPGTEIIFTDMDNNVWYYQVSNVETLQPTAVEQMIGKVEGDEWDLTLFTCNTGGRTRRAVRCIRVK